MKRSIADDDLEACPLCPFYHIASTTPFHDVQKLSFLHQSFVRYRTKILKNGRKKFVKVGDSKNNSYQTKCQQEFQMATKKANAELYEKRASEAQAIVRKAELDHGISRFVEGLDEIEMDRKRYRESQFALHANPPPDSHQKRIRFMF